MQRRIIAVVAAAVFSAGLAATAAIPANAGNAAPKVTVISQQVRVPLFYKWRFANPTVRPRTIFWGAGGGLLVKRLSWGHWNLSSAWGRGVRWANTCNPTCSAGNYIKSPATVTFWRWRWHNGHRYWTRLTLRWIRNGLHHKHIYYHRIGGDWP
jgi:hypothetical protein